MPPMTIMVASNNPSSWRGFNASDFVIPKEIEDFVGRLCQTPR
jgi:hypothetical protein